MSCEAIAPAPDQILADLTGGAGAAAASAPSPASTRREPPLSEAADEETPGGIWAEPVADGLATLMRLDGGLGVRPCPGQGLGPVVLGWTEHGGEHAGRDQALL